MRSVFLASGGLGRLLRGAPRSTLQHSSRLAPTARGLACLQLRQPADRSSPPPTTSRRAKRTISTLVEPLTLLAEQQPAICAAAEPWLLTPGPQLTSFLTIAPPVLLQAVFLSPLPAVKHFRDTGTTGDVSPMPYTSMVANGSLWFTYGALTENATIMLPNITAIVLGSAYSYAFFKYRSPQATLAPYYGSSAAVIAATIGAAATLPTAEATNVVGYLGCIVCVAMFSGPLTSIRSVLRDRSAASLPLAFTLVSCANTSVWLSYGALILHDPFIWGPNVLGLGAATAQLGLIARFGSGPPVGGIK